MTTASPGLRNLEPLLLICVLSLGSGCQPEPEPEPSDPVALGPCQAEGWGAITDPEGAIHLRADGSDDGDGSISAPVGSLDRAIELSREAGSPSVAVGPGEFVAQLELGDLDAGLSLMGCSPAEVSLKGGDEPEFIGLPLIRVSQQTDVLLQGFTLDGGHRSLWIWDGSSAVVENVEVVGATRIGVVVAGGGTEVELHDVIVADTVPETSGDETFAYGIYVAGSFLTGRPSLTMSGGGIWGSTTAGLVGITADLEIDGVTVAETSTNPLGLFGRGISLQADSAASISNSLLSDNADANLFALQSAPLSLIASTIEASSAALSEEAGESTGDGIVVTGSSADGGATDPAAWPTTLLDNSITGSDRAGVLLDHVTAEVSGNSLADNGLETSAGVSIICQNDCATSGDDSVHDAGPGGEIEPLTINLAELAVDTLAPAP